MIILPIGHEESTVRRLPWVSFILIGLNILFFITLGLSGVHQQQELQEKYEKVFQYWEERPYLQFPWKLLPKNMTEREKERIEAIVEVKKGSSGVSPIDSAQVRREQDELDKLIDDLKDTKSESPLMKWGLIPGHLNLVTLITSMFMHSGWMHLIINMLFLFLAGPAVEDCYGRPIFASLYLFSGIAGSLLHLAVFSASEVPLVGASGAISGLMGAFLIRFAYTKIKFFYLVLLFLRPITGTFLVPAWVVLPLWLFQQVFYYLMDKQGTVAYLAHVGGFAAGAGFAFVMKRFRIEDRFVHQAIEQQISITQHPALDEGMELLAKGDWYGAREALNRVLAEDMRHPDVNLAMWETYVQEGIAGNGGEFLIRVIENEIKRQDIELARDHWRELVQKARASGPAALRWRLAAELEKIDLPAATEVLHNIACDSNAGVLAEKAARRLEALGAPDSISMPLSTSTDVARDHSLPILEAVNTTPTSVPFEAEPTYSHQPGSACRLSPSWDVEVCVIENIQEEGIILAGGTGGSELLPFSIVSAVTVAGVAQPPRPILVVDMVLGRGIQRPVKVIRLLSKDFDPRFILKMPNLAPMEAFRQMVIGIASAAGASVFPGNAVLPGGKIPTYESMEDYEQEVLTQSLGIKNSKEDGE